MIRRVVVHNRFARDAQFERGDLVYDKADPRHVGKIELVSHGENGDTATVRWLETGWVSLRVPLRDLRPAPADSLGEGAQPKLHAHLGSS